jgi:Cu/Zn superoxide dismutase
MLRHHWPLLFGALAGIWIVGCAEPPSTPAEPAATTTAESATTSDSEATGEGAIVALFEPKGGSGMSGSVRFEELGDGRVRMIADLDHASPGMKTLYLHEFGDCSDAHADSAGQPWGDSLGTVEVDANGDGRLEVESTDWTFGDLTERDILHRSIVVHEGAALGTRVGCAVIERS